ncbi:hypothetical protein Ddc_05301 [Ditylenchus destructor]|nr:hypothetical protein Ddc_05301 [Ditylenchus destructor]
MNDSIVIAAFTYLLKETMGNSDSHLNRMESSQQLSLMDQQPVNYNYPDMNVIFKGIPKMMQVADDMHRMTNYIMDLRNMAFAMSAIGFMAVIMCAAFKLYQSRKVAQRRRSRCNHHHHRTYHHNTDSEQSSLSRPGGGAGSSRYSNKHNLDWSRHGAAAIDMEKLIEQSRQTPPHNKSYAVNATPSSMHAITQGIQSGSMSEYPQPMRATTPCDSSPPTNVHSPLQLHSNQTQPNGGHMVKRLDPVKLTVDEVPYADT